MPAEVFLRKLSLQDALDFAIMIEDEARERYAEFARQIGAGEVGDFFAEMAENEYKHAEELRSKRRSMFGENASKVTAENLYQFQDIEAPEFQRARSFMSIGHALQVAYDSEVKAHDFYKKVADTVEDYQVKDLFMALKDEEIEHQQMIKSIMKKTGNTSILPDVSDDDIDGPSGL